MAPRGYFNMGAVCPSDVKFVQEYFIFDHKVLCHICLFEVHKRVSFSGKQLCSLSELQPEREL